MRKLAFVFPGQGAQVVGMGKDLCEQYPVARETFSEANAALGFDLQTICFEGPMEELTKTEYTQPAILTHSIAAFRVLREEMNLTPSCLAGHSLGEYSALVAAGALNLADAVRLVHKRGQYMQAAVPMGVGAMMAVMKLSREAVDAVCKEVSRDGHVVSPANYNGSEQIVISGHAAAVAEAGEKLAAMDATTKMLNVSAPFHSSLMHPAAEKMRKELEQVTFASLQWPVIANVTAKPYRDVSQIVETLAQQVVHPVRWQETMEYLNSVGVDKVIEMGPGNVLKNLFKRSFPGIRVVNLDNPAQWSNLREGLGLHRDLKRVVSRSLAHAVSTRNRNFDQAAYQKGVIEPYQQIQLLQNQIENEQIEPTVEQVLNVLEHLRTIFATKQVPLEEQKERFTELFEETQTHKDFANFEVDTVSLI